jgi:hypothetical protein
VSRAAAIAMLFLAGCEPPESVPHQEGRACWAQHGDYTLCYAKCAAMNPKYHTSAGQCVRAVDEAAAKGSGEK